MSGNTTYFGIQYPSSSDYVKDGATAIQTVATGFDSAVAIPTYNAQTGTTYTFALTDIGKTVTASNAASQTYTIPPQASVVWVANTTLNVTNLGAGVVTFAAGAGVTVTNTAQTLTQYQSAQLIRTGSNAWTVVPTSGSAGSAGALTLIKSQVIGTTVSSVAVTNAFSTTYDAYKIVISGGSASATDYLTLKLGAITSGVDESLILKAYASGVTGASNTNQPYFSYAGNVYNGVGIFLNADVINPFLAKYTTLASTTGAQYLTAAGFYNAIHKANTSFTDFTIAPFSGTLTGGTIFVYGYGK